MNIKATVITVSYNSEKTIERTIKSVLDQTYDGLEYIIVDGASTDNTVEIIRKYEPLFNGRLRFISEPDKGMYNAMNKGIKMATGTIIGIINSDDWYEPDAIERIVKAYEEAGKINPDGETVDDAETGPLILCAKTCVFNDDKPVDMGSLDPEKLKSDGMAAHPSCFVTKDAYDILGGFDERYKYVGDYDLMLRAYEDKRIRFIPVDAHTSNYVIGGASASGKAYLELLSLQSRYGIISKKEYITDSFKARLAALFIKLGLKPISLKKL
ncbi:MAG: glycosyltransferase [Lachnospiraceae bacterium]|nr:glycosyltransferase [Lachnospiraceae bacterium]